MARPICGSRSAPSQPDSLARAGIDPRPDRVDHQDVGEPQHDRGAARPRIRAPRGPSRRASAASGAPRRPRSPRMCSTSGIRPTSGCAAGSSKRTPPQASTVRAPVAAMAQQHRVVRRPSRRQLVDVAAGHAGGAGHAVRDVGGARARSRRPPSAVGAASRTLEPRLALGDEVEDRVVLGRHPEAPGRRQLAVAVEALDQPQVAQDLGQRVVRLGPRRLVDADRRQPRTIG